MKKEILIMLAVTMLIVLTSAMADTMTVVSDTSVYVYGPIDDYAVIDSTDWGVLKSAVITWEHPSWPKITGATWISSADYTEEPAASTSWRLFEDVIEIPACATKIIGNISVTSDNAEKVYLNGDLIGSDGEVQDTSDDNHEWKTILNYELTELHAGTNTLQIIVRNYAGSSSPTSNPTGLIYKAEITYDADTDCDGVLDVDDMCFETLADVIKEDQSVNRWIWKDNSWETVTPDKKKGKGPDFTPTMDYTYGCSCTQILEKLVGKTGLDFGGHYKFGCSKSILEDWHNNEYFLETVNVPSDESVVTSSATIMSDETYVLKASGTYVYGTWAVPYVADAKCSYRAPGVLNPYPYPIWLSGDDLPSPYTNYLEVKVNGGVVNWGVTPGDCSPDNKYTMEYAGVDHLDFNIYDGGAIGDNDGSIPVSIFVKLW